MQGAENRQSSWAKHSGPCPWRAVLWFPRGEAAALALRRTSPSFCHGKQWWKTQPRLQNGLPRQAKLCRAWSWLTVMITSHMSSVHTLTIDLSALPPLPAQHPKCSSFTLIYLTLWSYSLYIEVSGGFSRGLQEVLAWRQWSDAVTGETMRKGAWQDSHLLPKRRGKHIKSYLNSWCKGTMWNGTIFVLLPKCEFCKRESRCLKGIQCPSRHHFSELTPQDHVLIGTACLCIHTPQHKSQNPSL